MQNYHHTVYRTKILLRSPIPWAKFVVLRLAFKLARQHTTIENFFFGDTAQITLSVSYNLFDGEELLEDSIMCIRNLVDHVSVVYQV